MANRLNIGMIGTGFMGRAHSNAYLQVPHYFEFPRQPVLKACCDSDENRLAEFAHRWGYESIDTDWRNLVGRDDIDLIDICTPNYLHHDIAIAAAQAGKMVICEKPLAMNYQEALAMTEAVEKAGVANMVVFNTRRFPAVALAKQLVEENRVGRPFHYNVTYNQDYTISPDIPQGGEFFWRLDSKMSGSGVTGDLLAHAIDTAEWLNGPISGVFARTKTFVPKRTHVDSHQVEPVTIDDACFFLAEFANGSLGSFQSTRFARGRKNRYTFEYNGENGAVFFDQENPHLLQYYAHRNPQSGQETDAHVAGWQQIHVTNPEHHPYMKSWWGLGNQIGYEHTFTHGFADFLTCLENGVECQPNFRTAARTQLVCDSVLESAKSGSWVSIS